MIYSPNFYYEGRISGISRCVTVRFDVGRARSQSRACSDEGGYGAGFVCDVLSSGGMVMVEPTLCHHPGTDNRDNEHGFILLSLCHYYQFALFPVVESNQVHLLTVTQILVYI